MKYPNCPECSRLWDAYAKATTEFFRLDGKLQVSGLAHDHQAVKELLPLVQRVAAERASLRDQIGAHETATHPAAERANA